MSGRCARSRTWCAIAIRHRRKINFPPRRPSDRVLVGRLLHRRPMPTRLRNHPSRQPRRVQRRRRLRCRMWRPCNRRWHQRTVRRRLPPPRRRYWVRSSRHPHWMKSLEFRLPLRCLTLLRPVVMPAASYHLLRVVSRRQCPSDPWSTCRKCPPQAQTQSPRRSVRRRSPRLPRRYHQQRRARRRRHR